MSNAISSNSGYTLTIKVAHSFAGNGAIPHAFVTISGPGIEPVTVGYYPQMTGVSGAGTVRNDALSHQDKLTREMGAHPHDDFVTFQISPQQALNALNFAAGVANNPGLYQLLGASDRNNLFMKDGYQCTGFVRALARAAGIIPQAVNPGTDETIYPSTLGGIGVSTTPTNIAAYPGSLIREFRGLDSNQVQPFRSAPDEQAFSQARSSLYAGIAAHDPVDPSGIAARIAPVGTVVLGAASNGSESAEVDPPTPFTPTVFNPSAALPNYQGTASADVGIYVIQSGDTVSGIASKLGMTPTELVDYLTARYSAGANLNSIVAGRGLPVPADKLAAYNEASINGLDLLEPVASTKPTSPAPSVLEADAPLTPVMPTTPDEVAGPTVNIAQPATSNQDPTDLGSAGAVNGHDHQSDNYVNVIDIPAPALANHFAGGNLGGAYGAGQLMGFDVLPFNEDSSFLTNADGDIVGEINVLANGYHQIKNLQGEAAYVAPSGQVLSEQQFDQARASELAGSVGLMNSIIGLQHWSDMGDLQRLAAVTSMYNVVNKLAGGTLPGDFGGAASVLGLLNALDQGNIGGAIVSGISTVNFFSDDMASKAIEGALGIDAANVVPGLSLLLALDSGDPVSVLSAAANFIPGWGQVASVVITLLGSMFADEEDLPMREGQAQANWDAAGNIYVRTTQDIEGGGPTASGWMGSFTEGLQARLAGMTDAGGDPLYGLIPQRLPSMGYQYDPDGMNFRGAQGHLYLKWIDSAGQEQTRYYDGAGNRSDGTGDTLAGDFMARASQAIVPAWQAQTVLAHWQRTAAEHDVQAADAQARQVEGGGLPQELNDGIHQSLQALTLALSGAITPTDALIDIDGDGYLEQTQWLATNQQLLAIDSNGDGQIGAGELLSLNGGNALNSLNWLDANNDGLLNASDPAFTALRLWMDVNSDGQSGGETQTLSQAGITAIDFGANPPGIIRADGSRQALTAQSLTGHILGVSYQSVTGGVLQFDEQRSAAAIATLHAVNTRQFDGQADYMHGGDVDTDGVDDADGTNITVGAGDSRLGTTTANTFTTGAFKSTQTSTSLGAGDARLQAGTSGQALSGQAAGQNSGQGNPQVRSTVIAFVPLAAAGPQAEARQALETMVRSATPTLFEPASGALAALSLGAAAVQWPSLVSAASPSGLGGPESMPDSAAPLSPQSQPAIIDWQALDGTRVSVAQPFAAGLATVSMVEVFASNQPSAQTQWAQAAMNSIAVEAFLVAGPPASSGSAAAPVAPSSPSGPVGDDAAPPSMAAVSSVAPAAAVLLDYPQVQGEQALTTEDTGLRFLESLLLANDSTLNSAARQGEPSLRITSVFAPVHGSVSLQTNAQGETELVFRSDANYHGPAGFSYTVTDQYGLSSTASVSLEVAAVNDAPVTTGEIASGDEDHTLQFTSASLLANDFDADSAVDGDVLRITRVGSAQHGQVFLAADGTVSFIPDANYNGPAQFSYWVGDRDPAQTAANGAGEGYETPATVNLTVLAVNDLPVVTGEVMDSDEDVVLDINPALLLANDSDVDVASNRQVLVITAVGSAQHGSIVLLADGTLRFTPEANYFGAAGFSYTVDDGHGGQVIGQVVVNLAPVNDAPDVAGETLAFNEDQIQTITQASLLANDADVDNSRSELRIVAVDNATHGTVALNPDGSIRFAPAADYFGPAQFTYTVSDGVGGFTVGTASLDIAPINDAPRLLRENLTLDEDTEARFSIPALLANDHDVDNLPSELAIIAVTMDPASSAAGTVQIVAGEIVFTPTLNFNGAASFTYTVADGVGGSSQATVNLDFTPVNDAPVANSELVWGKRDVSYTLSQAALMANDTDVESPGNLQVSAISNAQHGSAILNADGSVSFTPQAGYDGRGSFDYLVRDPDGATSTATAQIDFSRVNINPLATDDSFIGYEDVAFSITQAQLLINDSDTDNPAADLRVTSVAGAQNGTVSLQADGTVRFMPAANFYGTASFAYQVSDGEGGSTWATARLNVQSVNDAPVVEAIWYGTPIYGYTWTAAGEVETGLRAVIEEAEARGLLAIGQLHTGTPNILVSASYYQNGMLRPYHIDLNDGYEGAHSEGSAYAYDDTFRQNGRVIAFDPDGDSSVITLNIASGPQHGHAWANVAIPVSSIGTPTVTHEVAPLLFAPQTGAWQYYSHQADSYMGSDPFTIRVTDGRGASTTATVATSHRLTSAGGMYPIVVDLNGDSVGLIHADDSNVFADVNGDGFSERIGWANNEDGVLTFDANQDGWIVDHAEVSFTGYKDGALTDLEGLTAFDTNNDGRLNPADAAWSQFGILRDANGNGRQDDNEWIALDQLGITAIGLDRQGSARLDNGNVVFGTSEVVWADGHVTHAGDVMFGGQGVALPQHARDALLAADAAVPNAPPLAGYPSAQEPAHVLGALAPAPVVFQPTPEHMALLMVQTINAFTGASQTARLAAIEAQEGHSLQHAMADSHAQWEQTVQSQTLQFYEASS